MSCSNQTKLSMDYHHCSQSAKKKSFWYILLGKKRKFSYGTLGISRLANFKNRFFSSGQGVVQIKPNSVWSITVVVKVSNKKNLLFAKEKVSFSYGNLQVSRKTNLKNRPFLSGRILFESEKN